MPYYLLDQGQFEHGLVGCYLIHVSLTDLQTWLVTDLHRSADPWLTEVNWGQYQPKIMSEIWNITYNPSLLQTTILIGSGAQSYHTFVRSIARYGRMIHHCEIRHAYVEVDILRFPKWYDTWTLNRRFKSYRTFKK